MTNRNNSQYSFGKKHRYLNKALLGIKFLPININDYRYDDSGKIVNNKTGQTGTLASSEVKVAAKRPPVVNRLLLSIANGFIGVSVADAPSIATAGGWKRDKSGNWDLHPDSSTLKLSDNLAEISTMSPANYGTALADLMLTKVGYPVYLLAKNKLLFPYIKSYLLHPTWLTYYHGSPHPFNIKEAWMGTSNDMGLHATKNREVTNFFKENNPSGITYKFRAPRAKAVTSDLWLNGTLRHLSTDYKIVNAPIGEGSYRYFNILDKLLLKDIDRSKVPYKLNPSFNSATIGKYNFYSLLNNGDIHINPRSRFLKGIPKNRLALFNKEADRLIELGNRIDGNGYEANQARSELNAAGAKLLDDYGITTVKYYNTSPGEGVIDSYWINNPTKIDPLFDFNTKELVPGTSAPMSLSTLELYNTNKK